MKRSVVWWVKYATQVNTKMLASDWLHFGVDSVDVVKCWRRSENMLEKVINQSEPSMTQGVKTG